jgi:ABC-type nickel/cobalt efflux system permease component RcnA
MRVLAIVRSDPFLLFRKYFRPVPRNALVLVLSAWTAAAHPMGNFSVNHFARFTSEPGAVNIRYVLDLAEIPTFELKQDWEKNADPQQKALQLARAWAANLTVTASGKPVTLRVLRAGISFADGAGNMPVARITADLQADATGLITYEDRNYPGRAGWKEIVLPGAADRSRELTAYPQDPTVAPPQDLRASFTIKTKAPPRPSSSPVVSQPTAIVDAQPPPAPPGTVTRGDYLSRLLHRDEIGWRLTLIGMAVAFGLGAVHAFSPGHGKTIVAAYLVGSRGTLRHAAFLAAMVTFTHTVSVFFLGFVTLYLSKYVLPERLYPVMGAISGISIVWVGATLFFRRLSRYGHYHSHDDHHHDHYHGPGSHSHMPEGEITMGSLIALGASGGMVPCPSALVLLLSSISLGRVGLGLILLVGFSAGLAMVLMAIGAAVLFAGSLLPRSQAITNSRAMRLLPVASAAVVTVVGVVMTCVSLGILRPLG